jgi:hypothetical protein
MAMIDITDKLSNERPKLKIKGKEYEINNGVLVIAKFQKAATEDASLEGIKEALKDLFGKEACEELDFNSWSMDNFKVLIKGVSAVINGLTYEEADARFQKYEGNI